MHDILLGKWFWLTGIMVIIIMIKKKRIPTLSAHCLRIVFFFVVAHCGNSHIQFLCRLPETFVLLLYLYQIANVITAYNYVFCVINDSGLSVVTVMGTMGDPTTCFSPALFPWHGSSRSRQHWSDLFRDEWINYSRWGETKYSLAWGRMKWRAGIEKAIKANWGH